MAVRKYELMVILDPVRSDEDQQKTLDKLNETVTKYGGTPDKVDLWGKRRLAYQINKRREGFYALIYFDTDTANEVLSELERECRFQEEIMRHLITVAVTDKAKGDPSLFVDERPQMGRRPGGPPRGPRPDAPPPRQEGEESAPAPEAEVATEASPEKATAAPAAGQPEGDGSAEG